MDTSKPPGASLADLPPEVLHIIYLHVYPDDVKALRCTSRQLKLIGAEYPTDESPIGAGQWVSRVFEKDVLRGGNVLASTYGE
ncbi:hypothetical protein E4T39_01653 [Aureobasidium subglaciale]|nr:hypothetical protein E4T39_01653 [Aureobasidium subglaciale]